jgi:broad specificity phosphatase PhoE
VTSIVLIRHAEPSMAGETPTAEWPLTEKGRHDAAVLGASLGHRSGSTIVWTSPQRRASETAAVAFPSLVAGIRNELSEVQKPWYASADEHASAVARFLKGERVEGWERREDVITRITQLELGFASMESLALVTHGLLLTTWLDHEVGLDDPFSFWSNLLLPDAWEFTSDGKSTVRLA